MNQASHCFGFEKDFVGNWRCIPLCVRRKLDLIGVYYVEVPKKSEGLTLVRTDAFTHTALCSSNGSKEFDSEFTIDAIVGRLYIIPGNLYHYVKPFDDEGYRRSIVFNINCSKK